MFGMLASDSDTTNNGVNGRWLEREVSSREAK